MNDIDWYNVTEIAIGPIISIIIMIITLIFEKKHNKINLDKQQKNFEKSLKTQEAHYQETKKIAQEQQRIEIMPYLILDKVEIGERLENSVFDITLKNIGNNIATSVSVVYEENQHIIYTYKLYNAKKEFIYNGYLSDNILQINSSGTFETMLICDTTGIAEDSIKIFKENGKIEFSVTFCDIQMNKYSQSFSFYYNTINKKYPITRQETYPPVLITENQQ